MEAHIHVDNIDVSVKKNARYTILQACEQAGVTIPRFCYHERLSIAGNCRMCLVELEKSPKLVASCAMPVNSGMKIYTKTMVVKKARESVLEFLLSNHPLDCPICDQGGECDLQDQTMIYGNDRGRFYEYKRAVEDKDCGPLIKTIMTRCIHCTRCVRFSTEVAGVSILGVSGRGNSMEVGTYIEKIFDSELSGNVIDLCPVGALTSKPYAFTARSWELKSIESIDVMDTLGSNIKIDTRGSEIMRILPRLNEWVNEEWISDKARFSYDGLKRQRLYSPMVRDPDTSKLVMASWKKALTIVSSEIKKSRGSEIGAIVGNPVDCESMLVLKELMNKLGSNNIDSRQEYVMFNNDMREHYTTNISLKQLESVNSLLLIGVNLRLELPVLNARIRKARRRNYFTVATIGTPNNLTYSSYHLGNSLSTLVQIVEGKHWFCKNFMMNDNPSIFIGSGMFRHYNGNVFMSLAYQLLKHNRNKKWWRTVNVINSTCSQLGALEMNIMGTKFNNIFLSNLRDKDISYIDSFKEQLKLLYLIGESGLSEENLNKLLGSDKKPFIVYQGHHGGDIANKADVILSSSSYVEKKSTFINIEGRAQRTNVALTPPGQAKDDWKVLKALSDLLDMKLPYNKIQDIWETFKNINPSLSIMNYKENMEPIVSNNDITISQNINSVNIIRKSPFLKSIDNYYKTDIISTYSDTMNKCGKASSFKMSYTNF
uniref:NADH dehydrogenase subunit 11 n=1 Tax=Meteora sporadica TaxID=2913902 RepID=UPI003001556D|nr:NADH dehydrogenase subunit 11 [Meteora sporadica]